MAPGFDYTDIFILFIVFQVKHFLADFPLQREYMLKKDKGNWGFFIPLSIHCLVHSFLTLFIVLAYNPSLFWLAGVDFIIHFAMDRVKSGPRYLGRFHDKSKPAFWNCLGLDQMVHHLTSLLIIWYLVT